MFSYRCCRFFPFFRCCFLYCLPFIGELKIIIESFKANLKDTGDAYLNKLQHIEHQLVIGDSTFKTFDGKLANCKVGVCTIEKLHS